MRLIDIDAINWYDDLYMKGVNHSGVWVRYRDVEHLIRTAPTVDAEPVVRRKNCKWFGDCPIAVNADWYCATGKRREEDEP